MKDKRYTKLYEGFENRTYEKGEIKFKDTKLSDPHIQDVIKVIADKRGIQPQQIIDSIQKGLDKVDDLATKAPILYGTIVKNKVEGELFRLLQDVSDGNAIAGAPTFNKHVFLDLENCIKAEHDQFYPLRSWVKPTRLYNTAPYVITKQEIEDEIKKATEGGKTISDKKKQELTKKIELFRQIGTAAALPSGKFYFNRDFMQALINWAHIVKLKPKGKKYECNGGKIPDSYAYLEFLIMHEFMHYTYDDFYYQKKIKGPLKKNGKHGKANPTIINWVGDFRSNYILVKSGYEQLPIGLFSDDINRDRQQTYTEMYNLVAAEMAKLSKDDRRAVEDDMNDNADDHDPGQEEGADEPDDADEQPNEQPDEEKKKSEKPEKPEKKPYYVEDKDGNLTINGRDMFKTPVPGQTIWANIRLGQKDKWHEETVNTPMGDKVLLVIKKEDYKIDSDGNIVVRVKKIKQGAE
jgi:hypothetical protein